ncbi:MAG: PhoH family protein [Candidatus Firestonebacteria bacterium]
MVLLIIMQEQVLVFDMKHFNKITFDDKKEIINIFGNNDEHLRVIEEEFPIKLMARGDTLSLNGQKKDVKVVLKIFNDLKALARKSEHIQSEDVRRLVSLYKENSGDGSGLDSMISDEYTIPIPSKKRFIYPKTIGQKEYIHSIKNYNMVLAIGPAGTGKTYLAVAMAIASYESGEVSRIILTRPAVEAGEKLGFLPGTFQEKVHPYLRPLYDAIYDMMEIDRFQELLSKDVIEVAPLAYMRGRTLNDAFMILDEAQNTTPEQIKMFLTRLGFGSRVIITGDITQIDLPKEKISGLVHVQSVLKDVKGIKFVYLTKKDAVRHELVTRIIGAYEKEENRNKKKG